MNAGNGHRDITYHLEPGYIYVTAEKALVRTVLGSCVAVCLFDRTRKIGGMNHFIYPETSDRDKATAQYGNVATMELVRMMLRAGADKRDLRAQLFGGASRGPRDGKTTGERNCAIARAVLGNAGIPVISEDVGGMMGRKLLFDTSSGEVAVLKVHTLRREDWIDRSV